MRWKGEIKENNKSSHITATEMGMRQGGFLCEFNYQSDKI